MAMIYKFPACLQRIWKLHFANHFYRKSAMNDFQCIRYFSSTKKYYWESTDEQKTRNWKQIRKETYFILQVIMRTSQHLKEISSLKSICLVISRFTNMWFHFFFSPDKSITFPILERETPTKRSCMFTIWLSYLPDVSEAVFWLACML